jgi:lysophospholipase L1-like esterase
MPLLLLQAFWLRFKTLKLPEPEGKRSGHCGSGDQINVLIIGDSAAVGVGVSEQTDALAGQLSKILSVTHRVNWTLIAQTGLNSADLIEKLKALPIQPFDYILISVGVNDVISVTTESDWHNNVNILVKLLKTKFTTSKVLFSNVPPIHSFSTIPQPLRWWLGKRAKNFNQQLSLVIENNQQCSTLTLNLPFKAKYLAEDQFHPSIHTYQLWAKLAADTMLLSLQRK